MFPNKPRNVNAMARLLINFFIESVEVRKPEGGTYNIAKLVHIDGLELYTITKPPGILDQVFFENKDPVKKVLVFPMFNEDDSVLPGACFVHFLKGTERVCERYIYIASLEQGSYQIRDYFEKDHLPASDR